MPTPTIHTVDQQTALVLLVPVTANLPELLDAGTRRDLAHETGLDPDGLDDAPLGRLLAEAVVASSAPASYGCHIDDMNRARAVTITPLPHTPPLYSDSTRSVRDHISVIALREMVTGTTHVLELLAPNGTDRPATRAFAVAEARMRRMNSGPFDGQQPYTVRRVGPFEFAVTGYDATDCLRVSATAAPLTL